MGQDLRFMNIEFCWNSIIHNPYSIFQFLLTGGGGYCKWVLPSGFECKFNITKGP